MWMCEYEIRQWKHGQKKKLNTLFIRSKHSLHNYEICHAFSPPCESLLAPIAFAFRPLSQKSMKIYIFVTHSVNIIKYSSKRSKKAMLKEIINIFIYCGAFKSQMFQASTCFPRDLNMGLWVKVELIEYKTVYHEIANK